MCFGSSLLDIMCNSNTYSLEVIVAETTLCFDSGRVEVWTVYTEALSLMFGLGYLMSMYTRVTHILYQVRQRL